MFREMAGVTCKGALHASFAEENMEISWATSELRSKDVMLSLLTNPA